MGLFIGGKGVVWSGFAALLVSVCVTGCGGDDDKGGGGGSADFGQLKEEYAHPSGTLSEDDKDAIIAGLDNAKVSAESSPLSMTPRAGKDGPGPHVLATGGGIDCGTATSSSGAVNCTCDGGGSAKISYQTSQGSQDVTISESFDHCKLSEGIEIDGNIDYQSVTDPMLTIYKGSYDETVTPPGDKIHVDLNYALIDGMVSYSVQVGDGNVLIQATGNWDTTTKSGTFTVVTKDGSTSCTLKDGEGSCKGAGGSVTFS